MAKADGTAVVTQAEEAIPADVLALDETSDEVLRLQLDKFEGPIEVLLHLITIQEIDIFDIPIAKITDQYLRFLELMREQDLDIAGEYLVMAATLIQIKSKMLLPVEMDDDEEDMEEEDPRMELIEKLIEYRKYRDAAAQLAELEEERANFFVRNVKPVVEEEDDGEESIEVSLFDLLQAFKEVLRFFSDDAPHLIELEEVSVDERIDYIEQLLERDDSVSWIDLFRQCKNRVELVCSLLAILELCRMGRVRVHQHSTFGNIRLFRPSETRLA